MSDAAALADDAMKIAREARALFAGKGSAVTGAALAELVALHLACHRAPDDEKATKQLRDELLRQFVKVVKELIPIMEAGEVLPRLRKARAH